MRRHAVQQSTPSASVSSVPVGLVGLHTSTARVRGVTRGDHGVDVVPVLGVQWYGTAVGTGDPTRIGDAS
ncbi:hypothetical protein GS439_20310 [Rhodococcus hoagii]|nr:hypothetical protein [Prescottella equi]